MRLSGLAGLYCYFLAICHGWMAEGGLAAWLLPSEFMDVNYGKAIKDYLLKQVTLHRIHRFDPTDVQFSDALVSSAVLFFSRMTPPAEHRIHFTYGGTLTNPRCSEPIAAACLRSEQKWTAVNESVGQETKGGLTLGDLFFIKRGLATGSNGFFVMTPEEIEEARNSLRILDADTSWSAACGRRLHQCHY